MRRSKASISLPSITEDGDSTVSSPSLRQHQQLWHSLSDKTFRVLWHADAPGLRFAFRLHHPGVDVCMQTHGPFGPTTKVINITRAEAHSTLKALEETGWCNMRSVH